MSRFVLGALVVVLGVGCAAHGPGSAQLAPFDSEAPNSRSQLAQALRDKGFLAVDAPPGTQLGEPVRAFQKSEGLAVTGYPDKETLRRLGINPDTVDSSLDPRSRNIEGATGAGVSH